MENFENYKKLQGFDKEIYFKALISIAKADGIFKEIEKEYIKDQAKLMEFDINSMLSKDYSLSEINLKNSSSVTKKILIRDCISLALIDDYYHETEQKRIYEIGKNIGLNISEIKEIEKWLNDYLEIMEKAETIFTKE